MTKFKQFSLLPPLLMAGAAAQAQSLDMDVDYSKFTTIEVEQVGSGMTATLDVDHFNGSSESNNAISVKQITGTFDPTQTARANVVVERGGTGNTLDMDQGPISSASRASAELQFDAADDNTVRVSQTNATGNVYASVQLDRQPGDTTSDVSGNLLQVSQTNVTGGAQGTLAFSSIVTRVTNPWRTATLLNQNTVLLSDIEFFSMNAKQDDTRMEQSSVRGATMKAVVDVAEGNHLTFEQRNGDNGVLTFLGDRLTDTQFYVSQEGDGNKAELEVADAIDTDLLINQFDGATIAVNINNDHRTTGRVAQYGSVSADLDMNRTSDLTLNITQGLASEDG
jgi:hypothetical protein